MKLIDCNVFELKVAHHYRESLSSSRHGNDLQLQNNVECPTRGNFSPSTLSNLPAPRGGGRMTSLLYV